MNAHDQTKRMLDLQSLLNNFYVIERQIFLPADTERKETDTEHSYHLAMHAWYMSTLYPSLNQSKLIRYALAHDLVEIYAGDVMALGRTDAQQHEKEQKEQAALERLTTEWPDFTDMTTMIEDYEKQTDPEAVFVKALDKIMPVILNIQTNGNLWKQLGIRRADIIANKDKSTAGSPEVGELWAMFRNYILEHDELFNPDCI